MLLERYLKKQLDSFPEHLRGSLKDVPTMRMMATCDHLIITSSGFFFSGTPILGSYFGMQDQTLETKQHVLQVAGSLSARTKHPLFKAIALAASENGLPVREIDTDSLGSTGIVGKLDRTWYVMGDEKVMHDEGIELGVTSQTLMRQIEITGKQMLFLAQKQPKRLLGIFAFDKQLLPEMVGTVKELSENGIGITLLTTQKKRIAKGIADQIGIRDVRSELSKEDKSLLLASLQQEHVEAATVHNLQTLSLIGESRLPILISSRRNPTVPVNLTALGDISAVVQESRQAMARARKRFFWSKI